MFSSKHVLSLLWLPLATAQTAKIDLSWHAPKQTWINDLPKVVNGSGTHGFVFNSSVLPPGADYRTYNWCNMPHVRRAEYPVADKEYQLEYVEVIHRHHKRTPYASNTFPRESYPWDCSGQGLFYYGQPLAAGGNASAITYWSVFTTNINPFAPAGFNGTCQFPQITTEGLDDSWQHGKDLYGVYHDLLHFLPDGLDTKVTYRVTNNVITSQVAGMLVEGMYGPSGTVPLHVQPSSIDSLEPAYPCPSASNLSSSYGVGSTSAAWTAHLKAAKPLFDTLDSISGISPNSTDWHKSFDHYYDNLSARQCHGKPLPCSIKDPTKCVIQKDADAVYRLGQYEYSFIYRDSPLSLPASVGSYGVWIAEVAQNIRDYISGTSPVIYRHNVAHDGSLSRLLSILQVDVMVWVGMGSEVVFELYTKNGQGTKRYVRILWGGQILTSSNPMLGKVDMLDVDILLAYFDGLTGIGAGKVVEYCQGRE
ncbi:histidine acid phosphatase-like protein [Zopfia rhizophila CBS 207.26]|uniref:Histidine acid phosphatase-like protein n=1 Tax=Zopfia rhizophila CBS 207.26 TaxID=1314779 RepID=A0A6A6EN46_9PEZI|nr:histidine acid phosphatase-like protein [Zopfia rhizophila CBS 207.26]